MSIRASEKNYKENITEKKSSKIEEAVEKEVQEAVVFAQESPYPDVSEAYTDVFVD